MDQGLLLQIDAPDLAMERHTLFADSPLSEFLDWVALVIDAINDALSGIDPRVFASTSAGATTRGRTRAMSPSTRSSLFSTRPASARSSCRWPTHGMRMSTRASPDDHCPTTWRSSRASSTPRATTSSTRRSSPSASSASRWPSVTLTACSPRPTAGSTPPQESATSRPRSCGRSCERCAWAPTCASERLL